MAEWNGVKPAVCCAMQRDHNEAAQLASAIEGELTVNGSRHRECSNQNCSQGLIWVWSDLEQAIIKGEARAGQC